METLLPLNLASRNKWSNSAVSLYLFKASILASIQKEGKNNYNPDDS